MKWHWILALVFTGCGKSETPEGKKLKVKMGESFTISINANHTTAYRWYRISANPGLDSIGLVYDGSGSGKAGAGGMENWKFRAVKRGIDTLRFVQATGAGDVTGSGYIKRFIVSVE